MKFKYLFLFLVFILLFLSGCSSDNNSPTSNVILDSSVEVNIDKLEIYHFHATNQCYSCITVGDYAEETVNTYLKMNLTKE